MRSPRPPTILRGALEAWRAAAGYGSGAFHADGWASLGLMEKQEAVTVAARALAAVLGGEALVRAPIVLGERR